MIQLRASFKRFMKNALISVIGIGLLVALYFHFWTIITVLVLTIAMSVQMAIYFCVPTFVVMAIIWLGRQILAKCVFENMSTWSFRWIILKYLATISVVLGLALTPYAVIKHYEVDKAVQPFAEEFRLESGCATWECWANWDTIEKRDQTAHDLNAITINGWHVYKDSCMPFTDCEDTEGIYLWIPLWSIHSSI